MPGRASHLPFLQALSRHDRAVSVPLLLFVIVLSWVWLLNGAGTMEEMGGMMMPMSSGPWTAGHAALMFSMWAVMMAAMMLPSAMPMILLYAKVASDMRAKNDAKNTKAATDTDTGSAAIFAAGYIAVWTAFSAAATALQFAFDRFALLSPMMETTSTALAGVLLIAAGIYQWTPLKQSCLRHCRSPLDFILTQWRKGARGAFVMGANAAALCRRHHEHGMDCGARLLRAVRKTCSPRKMGERRRRNISCGMGGLASCAHGGLNRRREPMACSLQQWLFIPPSFKEAT